MIKFIWFCRTCKKLTQYISTCTGSIFFTFGGHKAWTHCATYNSRLTTVAGTIAFLCHTQDSSYFTKIEYCFKFVRLLVVFVTQKLIHFWRMNNFIRIENAVWVPDIFQITYKLVIFFTDHFSDKFSSHTAITMFTT